MKKAGILLTLVLLVLCLSGCGSTYELTDDENSEIAEYCAYLLLKYDKKYEPSLLDRSDIPTETVEEPEPLPEPTPEPTPEPIPEDQSETGSEDAEPPEEVKVITLSDVVAEKGIGVEYRDFTISDEYNGDVDFYNISAGKGQKVLALRFTVTNLKDKAVKFDLSDNDVSYGLALGKKSIDSTLSILDNDLHFMQAKLKKGQSCEAVLIYMIDENYDGNINFVAMNKEEKVSISIR